MLTKSAQRVSTPKDSFIGIVVVAEGDMADANNDGGGTVAKGRRGPAPENTWLHSQFRNTGERFESSRGKKYSSWWCYCERFES